MTARTQTQFHWVNKNTRSDSSSGTDTTTNREIRRFVQKQRLAARQRGGLQLRFSKHTSNSSTASSTPPGSKLSRSSSEHSVQASTSPDSRASNATSQSTNSTYDDESESGRNDRVKKFARRKAFPSGKLSQNEFETPNPENMKSVWRLSSTNVVDGSGVDPFNIAVQPMSKEADVLLSYYSSFVSSGYIPYKLQHLPSKFRAITPIQAVNKDSMNSAMHYKHYLYALFAFASVRIYHVMRLQLEGLKSPQYYMAEAVRALRQRLKELEHSETPIDTPTISAMATLALADWTTGDLTTAKIHLAVLAQLLQYVNIEDIRGRFLVETIRTADFQVAMESGDFPKLSAVPSFEPMSQERLEWLRTQVDNAAAAESNKSRGIASQLGREPRIPSEILDDVQITLDYRMGWALEEILETDIIESGLHSPIRVMIDVTTVGKCVWRLGVGSLKDAGWMCRYGRTQLHWLHTYVFQHGGDPPTPQALLTDCVRLALLIVGTLCTNRLSHRTAQRVGLDLVRACQRLNLDANMSRLAWSAYLWSLITAATIAGEGTDARVWLANRAADVALQMNMVTYEAIHEPMIGFLYSWTFSLQAMREVMSAMERRSWDGWN